MPATIINGFLYLGSYDTASRQELLKAMGITHILNVRDRRAPALLLQQCRAAPLLTCRACVLCADGAQLPGAVQEHVHLPHRGARAARV